MLVLGGVYSIWQKKLYLLNFFVFRPVRANSIFVLHSILLCKREDVKGDACPGKPKKFQNIILYTTSKISTLLSRIKVPGCLFFFGIFFHPGCLIRDSPLIKITKFYPGRMPNRYSPFIFFKDF